MAPLMPLSIRTTRGSGWQQRAGVALALLLCLACLGSARAAKPSTPPAAAAAEVATSSEVAASGEGAASAEGTASGVVATSYESAASSEIAPPNLQIRDQLERAAALRRQSPVDWPAVLAAYRAAAELGSPKAMSHVGWMHENGKGTAVNLKEAAQWYQRVAESGREEYAIKLGWLYLDPALGPNRGQAEAWFEQAIEQHDSADARVALASVWVADAQSGNSSRLIEAHQLLEQALDQNHPLGSYCLARIHVEGIGNYPATEKSRLEYTQLAAQAGHAPMQLWLAQRYLNGNGVSPDRIAAATWAALAAAQGEAEGVGLHQALHEELDAEERKEVLQATLAWALAHEQAPRVRAAAPQTP